MASYRNYPVYVPIPGALISLVFWSFLIIYFYMESLHCWITEKLLRKLSYIEVISFFHAFQMSEYVDDTEDFINIMLDDKQNQLLQMGVILSAANMILNSGIAVVGFFGMNIHVTLFDGKPIQFCETVIGTCGGCIALFLVLLGWGKRKKILAL